MFSGIVEDRAEFIALQAVGEGAQLSLKSKQLFTESEIGDSISVNGVCLTVVGLKNGTVKFDLSGETLRRTNLGSLKAGAAVNIEQALKVGSRLHGHFVTGHINCVVPLLTRELRDGGLRLMFSVDETFGRFVAAKGSITLDGVSLTVGEVGSLQFSVYIVPHTAAHTTLGDLAVGEVVNVEVDIVARYLDSLISTPVGVSKELLENHGYLKGYR